jgi:predicted aspartyl protease
MADEQKTDTVETATTESKQEEVKQEEVVNTGFSAEQVEEKIKERLARERRKIYKELGTEDLNVAKSALAEKEAKELEIKKQRGEFDEIMKTQADKSNSEIANLKKQLEQIKVNDSLLSSASKHKANVPDQVVQLLKSNVKLNDEGKVEILAENQQPRYNTKGELLSVDEYVQEFLTQNPHFQSATPSGSGSTGNVDRLNANKPFNIADLDMTNPEDRKRYAEYKKERDSKPTVINLT